MSMGIGHPTATHAAAFRYSTQAGVPDSPRTDSVDDSAANPVLASQPLHSTSRGSVGVGGIMSTRRCATVAAVSAVAVLGIAALSSTRAANPWDNDPAVQQVLELRRLGIAAMTSTGATAASERYSSTFVANTPGNVVVTGEQMLERFARGAVSYASVEQRLDYAASHGPDVVVLMGEEVVVPGPSAPDAGKRIHRRFTDVFRKENGEWRHDLRHANVIAVE